ncbi:uncharacterized protein LOC131428122 [Malaya genurostris]|uniref:uncharacterized protein LOC131428122 n=1 Tax=Malaya genurostris TaxID=325434 RepID=UPI0026F3A440|nr:uncharacterized protein LOC131428122 [Malaya genurostris]
MNLEEVKRFHLLPFNNGVTTQDLRREWEEWYRAFELMLELNNVETQREKRLLLLNCGGRNLQRIFCNLRPTSDEIYPEVVKPPLAPAEVPEYDNAIKRLNKFFIGKRNERIELEVFRSLKQGSDESFNEFILKLRAQASRCEFFDREEKELLQQVTMGARDERVRDKGLEDVMGLDELTNYAINREILLKQKAKIKPFNEDLSPSAIAVVNENRPRQSKSFTPYGTQASTGYSRRRQFASNQRNRECNRCGANNHRNEGDCYARNARCNACGRVGHFARKCRNRQPYQNSNRFERVGPQRESNNSLQESHTWKEELPCRPKSDIIAEVQ